VQLIIILSIFNASCMYRKIRCNKEYEIFKILQKFLGTKALFSWRIFLCLATVALLFLFNNYCLVMD